MKQPTRVEDERLLDMMSARCLANSAAVGRAFGMTGTAVRVATNRVRAADIALSGEDEAGVRAAYDWSE